MFGLCSTGIQREFLLDRDKPNKDQWFRDIWYSNCSQYFILVCCTQEQAKQFQYCNHLQMDMSFRMVAGKIMVFSLVGWCSRSKRMLRISLAYAVLMLAGIIPYCYAFTNLNTRSGYFQMFQMIFKQIANAGRILVHWSYLHNTLNGIKTIGLDMCKKQAGGKYMSGIC
jgi:hypothetical protein